MLPWLVRLRWVSVVALAAVLLATPVWGIQIPMGAIAALLAALAGTNLVLALQLRAPAPSRTVIGISLLVDSALLTGILYFAGGPMNPFSVVYLVGITLAAVTLGHRWALGIAAMSVVLYGVTFSTYQPLRFTDPRSSQYTLTLHLAGMWVALSAAAVLIAYFVGRVSEVLAQREAELITTRQAAERSERLAALLSLGAGAAHELATPLSSIRTAAGELERVTGQRAGGPETQEYLRVIRREIDRCAYVLDQLSGRAASATAADIQIEPVHLVDDVRVRIGDACARRLEVRLPSSPRPIVVPAEPLRQAVVALVQNAFDASDPGQTVTLRVEQQSGGLRVEVVDAGHGMSEDLTARIGEPFVTTKPPGAGLGLGLFLARALAEQLGGALRIRSVLGQGTSVVLELPAS
jgi:two-component system sensor histidine kinase RegB